MKLSESIVPTVTLGDIKKDTGFLLKKANRGPLIMAHNGQWNFKVVNSPTRLLLRAKVDNAHMLIMSSYNTISRIIVLDAKSNEIPMLIRKNEFILLAQESISLNKYKLPNGKKYSRLLECDFFQEVSWNGLYCLEIIGDCPEPYLLTPGKSILINAKSLIAMSKNIHITKIVDGTNLLLKAEDSAGYVIFSDFPQG